jgi:hypothetical protein
LEEEKERESATLCHENRALKEEKTTAMAKLQKQNQRHKTRRADFPCSFLSSLFLSHCSYRNLETEIETLHRRLEDKEFSQTTLVSQSEELRSVLNGLMGQLEVVAREEQTVKTRKKGSDKERDTLATQMERLLKVLIRFLFMHFFFSFSIITRRARARRDLTGRKTLASQRERFLKVRAWFFSFFLFFFFSFFCFLSANLPPSFYRPQEGI